MQQVTGTARLIAVSSPCLPKSGWSGQHEPCRCRACRGAQHLAGLAPQQQQQEPTANTCLSDSTRRSPTQTAPEALVRNTVWQTCNTLSSLHPTHTHTCDRALVSCHSTRAVLAVSGSLVGRSLGARSNRVGLRNEQQTQQDSLCLTRHTPASQQKPRQPLLLRAVQTPSSPYTPHSPTVHQASACCAQGSGYRQLSGKTASLVRPALLDGFKQSVDGHCIAAPQPSLSPEK